MTDLTSEMIDLLFDLEGGALSPGYPFALWDALTGHFPSLAEEPRTGVLPLRLSPGGTGMLLPKRAKLTLRLPTSRIGQAATALQHRELDVDGNRLRLGAAKIRAIQPSTTVHAQMVAGSGDEVLFLEQTRTELGKMRIEGHLICGLRNTLENGRQTISGFSLVIHDLKPEASVQLQYAGLGGERRYGCGIFVPYKAITGLEYS